MINNRIMSITKELYDEYVKKSFFTEKNFSGKFSPITINNNMIPYDKLSEFHYQTSFFLNFYASLYIELITHEGTNNYNIATFTTTIENLGIILDNTTNYSSGSNLSKFSRNALNNNNYTYTFFIKTFENFSNAQSNIYKKKSESGCYEAATYFDNNIIKGGAPEFGTSPNILKVDDISYKTYLIRSINININNKKTNYLSIDNTSKFKEILEEVFSQTPENILGYLLYKKIYYNIILYNISIQNSIRVNYLNEGSGGQLLIDTDNIISSTTNIGYIISNINLNTSNITTLNNNNFFSKNNFLLEKNEYINKITTLNTLRDEYIKIQDKLNISTKLYNQQFKNYKSIKTYAIYIIIALILIVISIISISIFPIFSIETKNALYIILLIILIVITFLYYTNFKYVNLYEKFTGSEYSQSIDHSGKTLITIETSQKKDNNKKVYNLLLPSINSYSNAYNDLLNNMRLNNYTIGSKTFSQDANIYLYNLYLEKKRQIEINKIKLTNLFNMIEVIKKQINYLFNIIFVIACFAIILLVALVIYSTAPHLYIFVIILCVVLISILMIYFAFAIIQPTRMIANKNYWATLNPSKSTYSKL